MTKLGLTYKLTTATFIDDITAQLSINIIKLANFISMSKKSVSKFLNNNSVRAY